MIGRWSEESFFSVFQEVEGRREKEARDKSGEVLLSLALFGRRVGVSSFRIPTAESPMSFARSLPREQEMLLCLLYRVQRNTHDDQQTCSAEEEGLDVE